MEWLEILLVLRSSWDLTAKRETLGSLGKGNGVMLEAFLFSFVRKEEELRY